MEISPGVNSSDFVPPLQTGLVSVQKTRTETALPTLWFQFLISGRQLGSELTRKRLTGFISALTDFR